MKVTEREVRRLLKKWRGPLGIDDKWEIAVTIYTERDASPKSCRDALAWIETSSGYFYAKMGLNAWRIQEQQERLELVVLHELVHITLDRMAVVVRSALGDQQAETAESIIESTTEQIARALMARR